jgi:hypothetical protein
LGLQLAPGVLQRYLKLGLLVAQRLLLHVAVPASRFDIGKCEFQSLDLGLARRLSWQ